MADQSTGKKLVKFHWNCGRMGQVEGLFVATQVELDAAIGKHVDFGEILGKHSDIAGRLDAEDITLVTDDQEFIEKLVTYVGATVSGYNPLQYLGE